MNSRLVRGGFVAVCAAALVYPHDPITTKLTWTQEISRVVYKRCAGCHKAGGAAMSLMTYEEARPWAKAIRDEVASRRMPPWGAVQGVGEFAGDPSLSSAEIEMLIAWVEGGAPEGDPAYLPHRLPVPDPSAAAVPPSRSVPLKNRLALSKPETIVGIRPEGIEDGASLEVWAVLPDQSVDRLIWLHDYRAAWRRTFVLREPVRLPAGTQLRAEGLTAWLLLR